MSFLLDTNIVSELVKPQPAPVVVEWLTQADEDRIFLSVVTLAELRYGIARLREGRRRRRLNDWLDGDFRERFDGRIVPVGNEIALAWGDVTAECAAAGRPIEAMDALIAATARICDFVLVTRNIADFETSRIRLYNPWIDRG